MGKQARLRAVRKIVKQVQAEADAGMDHAVDMVIYHGLKAREVEPDNEYIPLAWKYLYGTEMSARDTIQTV